MSVLSTLSRPVSVAAPGAWRIDAKSHDAMVVVWTGAVRHDAIAPADWLDRFASRFRELPSVGLIGAKRISVDRKLVSMGEFIIHPEPSAIEQAIKATKDQAYPATRPRFERLAPGPLPMADGAANTVYMLDVIEHLPNPTAVLREAARLIVPGGHLIVSTPAWQFGGSSDPTYHVAEYTLPELERQIETVTSMNIVNRARITGIYRDIIAIARR